MLTPEEIRDQLAYNLRAARVRAVYHLAMGESIVFRLTFADAPQFTITEDVVAETVTVCLPSTAEPLILHAREGSDSRGTDEAIRTWIEQHVNIAALRLKKTTTSAGSYWRRHPARRT
ncbi:MAG: hypothetical protein ACTHX2_11235 [Microbacterium sp.]